MNVRAAVPADAHGIARVHVDSWRTTYAGIVPDKVLARLSYSNRERFWHNVLNERDSQNSVFVAESNVGEIAGFVSGGPEREGIEGYDGELYAIYLYADVQGQGTGRQLTVSVANALAKRGFHALLTWVLADNPACGFYEALGGHYVTAKTSPSATQPSGDCVWLAANSGANGNRGGTSWRQFVKSIKMA